MPPLMLSRDEYASLKKIINRAQPVANIPEDHAAKFMNYGLARRDVLLLRITQLGQLEFLRQRFHGITRPNRIVLNETTTRGSVLFTNP